MTEEEKIAGFKLKHKLAMLEAEKNRNEYLEKLWNNLPTFLKPEDVPNLPIINDAKIWTDVYVPKLIKAGAIPKKDLVDGEYYLGDHRNATVAKWDAKINKFVYNRFKFGAK